MGLIIRSSDIHAAGCYTTAKITQGTRVVEYTGPRMPKDVADELYENRDYTYLFGLEDGVTVIDGHGIAAFLNHSCDPNCETEEDEQHRVWILARRDIEPEEELTYDYNLYDGEGEAMCSCGTRNCRGTMYSVEEIAKRRRTAARKKKSIARKKKKKI